MNTLKKQIGLRDNKIESQAKHIEVQNKVAVPVSERYLEILYVDSSSSKITINPRDGRVTLKISDKIKSNKIIKDYAKLTDIIMNDSTLPSITMRGKIKYDENKYKIVYLQRARNLLRIMRWRGNEIN